MYVLSRFTRFACDSQIIAAYNYRTGKLITEPCGTNSFEDLEKLRSGTIDQNSPLFQTLLSNGFIVDAQYDELQALKEEYRKNRLNDENSNIRLTISVNEQCNFHCLYCYEHNGGGEIEVSLLDSCISFLTRLVTKQTKQIEIAWFGGEPLLSLSRIIHFMRSVNKCFNNYSVKSTITTNGYLLDLKTHLALVESGIDTYQITVDAFEHDRLRKTKTGDPSFDVIVKHIKQIISSDTPAKVILRINLNPVVYAELYRFLDYVKTFANSFLILEFHPISDMGGQIPLDLVCDPAFFNDVLPDINAYCIENGLQSTIVNDYLRPFSGTCYAGKKNCFLIDRFGIVRKCTVAYESIDNIVGSIQADGATFLDDEANALWCHNYAIENDKCLACDKLPVCIGPGCPLHMIKKQFTCNRNDFTDEILILQTAKQLLKNQLKKK